MQLKILQVFLILILSLTMVRNVKATFIARTHDGDEIISKLAPGLHFWNFQSAETITIVNKEDPIIEIGSLENDIDGGNNYNFNKKDKKVIIYLPDFKYERSPKRIYKIKTRSNKIIVLKIDFFDKKRVTEILLKNSFKCLEPGKICEVIPEGINQQGEKIDVPLTLTVIGGPQLENFSLFEAQEYMDKVIIQAYDPQTMQTKSLLVWIGGEKREAAVPNFIYYHDGVLKKWLLKDSQGRLIAEREFYGPSLEKSFVTYFSCGLVFYKELRFPNGKIKLREQFMLVSPDETRKVHAEYYDEMGNLYYLKVNRQVILKRKYKRKNRRNFFF